MKSQEDTLGKTTFDFHPPELAKQYYEDEMKLVNTGEPLIEKEELILRQDTNEFRWHLTSKVPLKDSQGKVTGFIVIARDITDRKRTEEALRERDDNYVTSSKTVQIFSIHVIPIKSLHTSVLKPGIFLIVSRMKL